MRTDWKKITEEAFSSDEIHVFSEDYCRRRSELQGGITMEKKRITQKTNRFNARIAATAAAFLVIPAATIGVTHFAQSSGDSSNTNNLFNSSSSNNRLRISSPISNSINSSRSINSNTSSSTRRRRRRKKARPA